MKDYIGLNIKYLCENNFLSQDEFGAKFGLKKSVVGTYIRGVSYPKIEVIQKICNAFSITLDEFINHDLYLKNNGFTSSAGAAITEEPSVFHEGEKEALLKAIQAQKETIDAMKITIDTLLHRELAK